MVIILLIIIILLLFIIKNKEQFKNNISYSNIKLACNHYKFKSDEEYLNRTIEFNKNGYMKNKLSSETKNNKWKIKANIKENKDILLYLKPLKKFMKKPLKKVIPFSDDKNYKYLISVVVMFRYEVDYLEEWLNYYIMNGITHFYMYSNENTKKTTDILKPYIDNGYITLIDWSDENHCEKNIKNRREDANWNHFGKISLQNCAFRDFNTKYKNETKWIIKVDVDEFVYIKDKFIFIKKFLKNTEKKYLNIPRTDFGNNGHKKKQKGLIIENYIRSDIKSTSQKSLIQTQYISKEDRGGAHHFLLSD